MKKFLKIAIPVVLLVVVGMYVAAQMQVSANDDALAEIKSAPDVIVLKVSGMT